MRYNMFKNNKLCYLGALLLISIYAVIFNPTDVYAEDTSKTETLILDSAEKFFISLKKGNFKTAWELLSEKSHKTIIDDVYNASKKIGVEIKKEDIIKDFNSNGAIFNNYWKAFLNNFNPDIALKDRIWELEEIKLDYAVILLKKNEVVTELQMYNEKSQWKVGFVETFWEGKAMKIINFMSSLFF